MPTKNILFFSLLTLLVVLIFSCEQIQKREIQKNESTQYDSFMEQSITYLDKYKYDTVILYTDSALTIARQQKNSYNIANALRYKGVALRNSGLYDSSKASFFQARSICRNNGYTKLQALTELSLSTYYLRIGKNDSAIYYNKTAIQHYEKIKDSSGIAMSTNSMGVALGRLGHRDEALQYYFRAEDLYNLLGDKQRQAYVLNNIGIIFKFFEDYDKALDLFEKCKAVSLKAENHNMTMTSSLNIAGIYYFKDETKKAEEAYLEAIELNNKQPKNETLAAIYISLAAIYAQLNNPELGFEYATKAIEIAKKTKDLRTETQADYKIAHYYLDKNKLNEAEKYFKKTISGASKIGDVEHLSHSYKYLSSIQEKQGDFKKALANYKLSTELNDSIINEKKLEIIYRLESKYEKKKNEAEILLLSQKNAEQEIRNQDLKIVLVSTISVVALLIGILFFIRLKTNKDRIIANQKIQQLQEEQKLLAAQSVIVGQENERKRIAQELHDGIGVLLSTASIHFSNVEHSADEKTAELLSKANKLLKQAGGEVRKISHEMMPGVLSKFGLQEALEDIFENVEDTGKIEVDCQIELNNERLSENTEIILFRIVQEILNNSLKHAHANKISFSMKKEMESLIIRYSDDGNGFEQSEKTGMHSLGLSGIKSRIDFLKGKMELVSSPGKGIDYHISIPV